MKLSQFNSTLPYLDNFLLHNTFSDHYIVVKPLLKELLEAAHNENDVAGLKDYHPAFFEELVKNNFIIEDDVNEVNEVKKISEMVDGNDAVYTLTINPTMGCNFKCWYCYETHINGSKLDEPIINRILKFIENEKANNPKLQHFTMAFFGGEPLLYYEQAVVPLLEGANEIFADTDITFTSGFTTNGYLIDQRKIDFFKEHCVNGVQITLDGNKEFHNKVRYVNSTKGSYERIIANIKLLALNGIHVTMRINFTQENFESCLEIPEDFNDLDAAAKKQYILVDFHQVWQDDQVDAFSVAPAVDIFKKAGFEVRSGATNLNNVVDSCYADKNNSSVINYNGEVFKCTARDFTTENSLGTLENGGVIKWKPEYERRQTAKFKNAPCLECRLLPICNGGCSQHAYENLDSTNGYCVYGFDEYKKDAMILERFRARTNA